MPITLWSRLKQLSIADRWVLCQAVLLLPLVHLGLLLLGYYRLRLLLEWVTFPHKQHGTPSELEAIQGAQRLAGVVAIASRRGLIRATCLRSSLLLWWLLREQGMETQVCFGVRMNGSKLEAHAWVEYSGTVLNDFGDTRRHYQALGEALPLTTAGL